MIRGFRLPKRLPLPRWRPSTLARVTFGIVSLTLALALGVDAVFHVLRDDVDVAREVRKRVSENVAIQISVLANKRDYDGIERTAGKILAREPDLLSVAVRRADGEAVFASPAHEQHWQAPEDNESTLTHVVVPLLSGGTRWGQVEIAFRPVTPSGVLQWLAQPVVLTILVIGVLGAAAYYLFLRRTLQALDPSKAIPDSVAVALDTLAEGLMILDTRGRMLMVNRAFQTLHPDAANQSALGRPASTLPWLCDSLGPDLRRHPWNQVIADGTAVTDVLLEIRAGDRSPRKVRLNASPVRDAKGAVRGCFVSFNDVTELHEANEELQSLLDDLRAREVVIRQQNQELMQTRDRIEAQNRELQESNARIEVQNRELERLAHYDPLTGIMNRRAFMDRATGLFEKALREGTHVAVIMTDIDKFKSVNDTYGHAVGDEVIQQVARVLSMGLRPADLLCRYGGEEFCILLPGLDPTQALAVGRRLCEQVEAQVGPGLRSQPDLKVTSSFGVSELSFGASSLKQMMEEADQALYASKQAGRNFVTLYSEMPWFAHDLSAADLLRVRELAQQTESIEIPGYEPAVGE